MSAVSGTNSGFLLCKPCAIEKMMLKKVGFFSSYCSGFVGTVPVFVLLWVLFFFVFVLGVCLF